MLLPCISSGTDAPAISRKVSAKSRFCIRSVFFEPGFTTKEAGKGTGLGLSICRNIIRKHNGDIKVESEVDKGAKFKIRLPIDQV